MMGGVNNERHAWKATPGLSIFNRTGLTQPEIPRAGQKWSPMEGGAGRADQTTPGEEDHQINMITLTIYSGA